MTTAHLDTQALAGTPRGSPRFSCNFSVTVKFPPDAEENVRSPLSGRCDNVSLGGALVLLPERVALGSDVTPVFATPAGDTAAETPPIEAPATVVWVLQSEEAPLRFRHGLRFLQPQGRRLSGRLPWP
ncbi:MAG: PilZ domain-containing protein [Candidatus Methylomirabilales bacterium]